MFIFVCIIFFLVIQIVDYNGERTLEAMHKFVDSNGTVGAGDDEDLDEEELDEVRSAV